MGDYMAHLYNPQILLMARQRIVMCSLFLLVCMVNGAAALDCAVHLFSNGSALYSLSEAVKPGCDTDWSISGVVVAYVMANVEEFNRTLVIGQTYNSLLLYNYHPQTQCEVNCAGWRQNVTCNDPTHDDGVSKASYDGNSGVIAGALIAAVALIGLVLALLSLVICWRKEIGCFRKGKQPIGDAEERKEMV